MKMKREQVTAMQMIYRIKIEGILDPSWSEWFGGLTITPTNHNVTSLSGPVRDQAALHGLLAKVRDMGLPLLSVERIEVVGTEQPG